jgi:hypothetical protein
MFILLRYLMSAGYCPRALVDESELLELRWRRTIDYIWSQCLGCLVRYHPVTVTVEYLTFYYF